MTKKSVGITRGVILVVSIASVILLAFLLRSLDWNLIQQTGPLYLGIILLLSVFSIVLYTLEVYILLRAGGFGVSLWQTYLVLTSSMSANYVTPVKVGIPLRIYLYRYFLQIPAGMGTALIAIETLLGMTVPSILSIVGIVTLFPEIGLTVPVVLLIVLLSGLGMILLIKPQQINLVLGKYLSAKATQRITKFINNLHTGLRTISGWNLMKVIAVLLLSFVVTSARMYFILQMLGRQLSFWEIFCTRVISVTAGSASMIPMGLGIRDASVTFLLVKLGTPNNIALSVAAIERLFSPGFPLLLGIISANILGVSEVTKHPDNIAATEEETFDDQAT